MTNPAGDTVEGNISDLDLDAKFFILEDRLQKADIALNENKRLHEMVDALEARLVSESDIKVGLIRTIRDLEQKNTIVQGQFDQMTAIVQKMDEQRIALKAALKAVL